MAKNTSRLDSFTGWKAYKHLEQTLVFGFYVCKLVVLVIFVLMRFFVQL